MTLPTSYLLTTKNLDPILESMKRAAVPPRVSISFLRQLGYASSGDRPLVPLMKALGLIDGSGAPTERYSRFRDETQSAAVLAEAMREAYADVFAVNQRAYELSPHELKGIFSRLTGKQEGVVEKMATTFKALARRADFQAVIQTESPPADGKLPAESASQELPSGIHPLILGLLRELPPPGAAFSVERQKHWLEIAQSAFSLIYGESQESEGHEAPVDRADSVRKDA